MTALLGATPGVDFAAALGVYEAAKRPAREVYEAAERTAREVYEAAERPAREVYEAAMRTAWEVLAEAVSTDPLGAWIMAEIFADYQAEALIVLAALPCTADTLHALAADEGWCGAWGEAWSRAVAAGVVPADAEATA